MLLTKPSKFRECVEPIKVIIGIKWYRVANAPNHCMGLWSTQVEELGSIVTYL